MYLHCNYCLFIKNNMLFHNVFKNSLSWLGIALVLNSGSRGSNHGGIRSESLNFLITVSLCQYLFQKTMPRVKIRAYCLNGRKNSQDGQYKDKTNKHYCKIRKKCKVFLSATDGWIIYTLYEIRSASDYATAFCEALEFMESWNIKQKKRKKIE